MTARLHERTFGLVRFGAWAAILAGVLRFASSFIPYEANSPSLEALYGVIDLGLMFGLIAVYLATAEAIGLAGVAAFLVALTGVASIVGPDSTQFGIDFYRVGALIFVVGLAALAIQLLRARILRPTAILFLLTLAASLATPVLPQAFLAAGLALGTGYILAGLSLLSERRAGTLHQAAAT